jgi:membrane protein implicated in regulation of membrane protease activity
MLHSDDMSRGREWWILGAILLFLGVALAGAARGWFGPLLVCGADGVAVCVAWPGVVSATVWALYILFFLGIAGWQIMMWRREPAHAQRDGDRSEAHGR